MQVDIDGILAATTVPPGLSFYHEVDNTLYSASSASFIGQIYALLEWRTLWTGRSRRARLSQLASNMVSSDPDLIFLADSSMGVTRRALPIVPGGPR
jgi:iron complex transport system substrate-binding protein